MSDYLTQSEGAGEAATSTAGFNSEPMFTSPPTVPVYIEPEVPDPPLQSPNRNKDVPPPPQSDSDEEDSPELYLPGLCIPTMFLPIPNTDPLTTLLNKYIHPPDKRPVRDLTGEWQRSDFHTLVMSNSWRALARMARDRICTNLFSLLNAIEPTSTAHGSSNAFSRSSWKSCMRASSTGRGDHMAYIDALYALLRKCKVRSRRARGESTAVAMWKERGARICLIIASQFMEMKVRFCWKPLCDQGDASSPALRSASGNLGMAAHHFKLVSADPDAAPPLKAMNAALLTAAEGDWAQASEIHASIIAKDPDNYVAVNNLCVALLSQGKLKEGIESVIAEPFLFNLSTLYELRSATAIENKRQPAHRVAQWSGDGLKTTC
ncbi:hypothetical protein B0H14DRAFT_2707812 [Mycena olivaceomarginata]|nr:hypothetical protein B0H14DRAFT_2707812 [Mycena olivaceomarginata]